MKEITNANQFQELVQGQKPVLLDFYADWCGPCQTLLPIVEKLAVQHENDFEIVKVNVDKNPTLAQQFQVRSIPMLFIIKDQEVKEKMVGVQTEAALHQKIHNYSSVTTH